MAPSTVDSRIVVNRVLTKEQVEHQRELKDLPGNLDYRRESPTVQSYMPGTIHAAFPSSLGLGVGDSHISTFWLLLYWA